MDKLFIEESPSLPGPDYVAVVIDWDEDETTPAVAKPPEQHLLRTISLAAGAIATLALATWGIRRWRAA